MSGLQPLPAPGWYDDGSGRQRWWNGTAWTEHFAPLTAHAVAQVQPVQPAQPMQRAPYPYAPQAFVRPLKDTGTAYLFAILLSGFGAHQFYLSNVGAGIGYILLWWIGWALSFVGVGFLLLLAVLIWWIVDLCTLRTQVETANRRILATPIA